MVRKGAFSAMAFALTMLQLLGARLAQLRNACSSPASYLPLDGDPLEGRDARRFRHRHSSGAHKARPQLFRYPTFD